MINFASPDMTFLEQKNASEVIRSHWLTAGPKVNEFAEAIRQYCGADHAVCYDSCTAAMEMSLRVLGVGPGDEVITTPYTYTATAEVIRNLGAKIVFCDLQPDSFEMDYSLLGKLITPKTKAIIPVDIGGKMCDYGLLLTALKLKANVFVPASPVQKSLGRIAIVADAAHSFGASRSGRMSGSVADFTCFSFHVLKVITTGGEGGAVLFRDFDGVDNEQLEVELKLLGDHGQTRRFTKMQDNGGNRWEYDIALFGYNHIMTDVDATVGLAQLVRMDELVPKRARIFERYDELLRPYGLPAIQHFGDDFVSSMHLYPVRFAGAGESERNRIFAKMYESGISCNVHYKPLPMFTAYRNAGYDIDDYPEAYAMYANLITLPCHTLMDVKDVEFVCETLYDALGFPNGRATA